MLRPTLYVLFLFLFFFLLAACGKTEHLQGKALYAEHCANCHMDDGAGLRMLIPPLAGADYLREQPEAVVLGIRKGMNGPMLVNGKTYNHEMPANVELSEFQIVNIVNYINQAWGNDYGKISVEDTRRWLDE